MKVSRWHFKLANKVSKVRTVWVSPLLIVQDKLLYIQYTIAWGGHYITFCSTFTMMPIITTVCLNLFKLCTNFCCSLLLDTWLPVISNIEAPALRRKAATDKLVEKVVKHDSWPIQPTEPFSHRTGTLRCLQKEMATYRHWYVSLWRDPDDVSHCLILLYLTKMNGGFSRLHSADEDAVSWLTNYGSWHA